MGKRSSTKTRAVPTSTKPQEGSSTGSSVNSASTKKPYLFPSISPKESLKPIEFEADQIILLPDVFDEAECKLFIKFIDELPLELTPAPKKGEALRVNYRMSIQSQEFANSLFTILLSYLPEFAYPASRVTRSSKGTSTSAISRRPGIGLNSNIRLYRYTQGQHFGQHYDDAVTDPVTGLKSEWTLLIYLSGVEDGVKGGETIFYKPGVKKKDKDIPIKPELHRGMALLHRHGHECLLHEGALVEAGTKYVLRSDIMFSD